MVVRDIFDLFVASLGALCRLGLLSGLGFLLRVRPLTLTSAFLLLAARSATLSAFASGLGGETTVPREGTPFGWNAFTTLAAGFSGQVWILREAPLLGWHALAAFARDLPLSCLVHRSEPAVRRAFLPVLSCHGDVLSGVESPN